MNPEYAQFLKQKAITNIDAGFHADESKFPAAIFPHQSACVKYACKKGRSGLFLDTGLGKTITQLTWAEQVRHETGGIVLVLAPLAVASQTEREGAKFGISVKQINSPSEMGKTGIYVTNYEKLHLFEESLELIDGVVLDESSILKGMDGKMRRLITDSFSKTPYRLSCSATPSPNDFMELGTQAEFLGVMTQTEMLATFFIHDGGDTSKWRLKGHGRDKFFEWLASWSIFLTSPADLGFDGDAYVLPPIHYHHHVIETEPENGLFVEPAQGLLERNKARRDTVDDRCKKAAEIINALDESAVVWCHLNDESALLSSLIDGAIEVKGSDSSDHKVNAVGWFLGHNEYVINNGRLIECPTKIQTEERHTCEKQHHISKKVLVSKPRIFGYGLNFQSTRHAVFVGLSDSWESFYQAIRRQWRFGQTEEVHVHIVSADIEGAVVENIQRKDAQHKMLMENMMRIMRKHIEKEVFGARLDKADYNPELEMKLPEWIK